MTGHRRLKIAFAVDVFDGARNGGAISARRFAEALAPRHDITVVTTGAPGPGRLVLPAFYVPGFRRVMREMGFPFAVPRRAALEALFREVDLVHVQFPFWLGFRAAALARRVGAPVVAGFHVQPENMLRNVGIRSDRLASLTYRLFRKGLYDGATAVVCPSEFARDELRRHGLQAPAEVISNGIAGRFRPLAAEERTPPDGLFRIAVVGRLAREKRHDVIAEGIRRSRFAGRIRLSVAGSGPERERVERHFAGLPHPARIAFLAEEELARVVASADLLLHASEVELEGMAVLEALGCGTPSLIADAPRSATRQFALSPEFLFRPGDPADLARRLDALLERPDRLGAAREGCLALAGRYAFGDSVRRLEELYQRVARPPGGRQA
jgi:1,2-diacylglycerol 3-alpha-glucosyltransferase